jgi:hypothetical protein
MTVTLPLGLWSVQKRPTSASAGQGPVAVIYSHCGISRSLSIILGALATGIFHKFGLRLDLGQNIGKTSKISGKYRKYRKNIEVFGRAGSMCVIPLHNAKNNGCVQRNEAVMMILTRSAALIPRIGCLTRLDPRIGVPEANFVNIRTLCLFDRQGAYNRGMAPRRCELT